MSSIDEQIVKISGSERPLRNININIYKILYSKGNEIYLCTLSILGESIRP